MLVCEPTHMQWKSGESVGSPGTGVTGDCKPPNGCWDPNLGLQLEQYVLFRAELSLQHSLIFLFAVVDVCILWQGFCSGAQAGVELGISYGLQATHRFSFFFFFPFRSKTPSLAPKNRRLTTSAPFPLVSYWKSSVTRMLPQLLQGHCLAANFLATAGLQLLLSSVPPLQVMDSAHSTGEDQISQAKTELQKAQC